jgi:hypothetical protein
VKHASVPTLRSVAATWRRVRGRIFDSYRPERHYMRGPGPKWHAARRQAEAAETAGTSMKARIAMVLGITLSAIAAVDPKAAAAADRRAQLMKFELLREGPADTSGSSCGAWISAARFDDLACSRRSGRPSISHPSRVRWREAGDAFAVDRMRIDVRLRAACRD